MKTPQELETPVQRTAAGIILAAGTSSRMGHNKLLVGLEGEPMIRRVVLSAQSAGLSPILVVLGHERERVVAALHGIDYSPIVNKLFESGMTSSLRTGVTALPPDIPAAVMILGDMPWVSASMLASIAARFFSSGANLVLSDYGGVQAPPTLFGRDLFFEILDLDDDRSPRSVVRRHAAEAQVMHWPAERLEDLDRPEDLERLRG